MAQIAAQYNCNYDGTMNFSGGSVPVHLTANTEVTFTLPGSATTRYTVEFNYNSNNNYYVAYNTTAAVPAANTAAEIGVVEYKPHKRFAFGGDVLHFISPDAVAYMGFSYRITGN